MIVLRSFAQISLMADMQSSVDRMGQLLFSYIYISTSSLNDKLTPNFIVIAHRTSLCDLSHLVHLAIAAPSSEGLALVVEQNPEQAPQRDQTHVRHDDRHKSGLERPRRDEG